MPQLYSLLKGYQKQQLNRLKRVMLEGSPRYHWDVTALAAGVYEEFDVATHFPRAKKYEPLDTMVIINNDAVDIEVLINGLSGDAYVCIAGTIRTITREQTPAIWQIRITNLHAVDAVTVNLIGIDIWRSPEDADSIARRSL